MEKFETLDKPIGPPLRIEDAGGVDWYAQADVVVVGFGAAGASAALEAAGHGAEVIAVDRFEGGGATAFSGGVIYAGGGTRIQVGAGVIDTPEEMTKYLAMEVGDAVAPATIRRYCEESKSTIDWLMQLGVPYDSTFYKEKIVYPPEGYFLQYSGNEKVPEYARRAVPAARGHRAVGKGFTGYAMYEALKKAAQLEGIRLITHSPVTRLIVDKTERVIGVEINMLPREAHSRHRKLYDRVNPTAPFNAATAVRSARAAVAMEEAEGKKYLIQARQGVLLSTGGFAHNMSMLREHIPFLAQNIAALMRMSSLGCNGSGIRLGQSVGGVSKRLDRAYIGRNMAPPAALLHGVMVNCKGERFVNEGAYNSIVGRSIADQPNGEAWLILSRAEYWQVVRQSLLSGWATFRFFGAPAMLNVLFGGTQSAARIEELAAKCKLNPGALRGTIDRYNETIGNDDDFGKVPELRVPLRDKRFYAINFSIPNKFAFSQMFTIGGLQVNESSGAVLRKDGSSVEGLFAAGRTAFGLCSNNYVSGLSIGDCVFTGRRAARHMVARAAKPKLVAGKM